MKDIKSSLFSLFVGTLTSLTVCIAILITINPYKTDIITQAAFFASLFLTITGIISFLSIFVGSYIWQKTSHQLLSSSIIQATIISLTLTSLVLLQSLRVLGAWEIIIILLIFGLIQFYIRAQNKLF